MSRAAAVIILIGIILLGLWWFTSENKAVGESQLYESTEEEPGTPPENTTTTTPATVTGKFIVELLGEDGKVLASKNSILYAITGVTTYPRVDKIRFRIEGVNPTHVCIYMTVFKIGEVTTPPETTTTYVSPTETTTTMTYITTTTSPITEEPSPEEPEPLPTVTTTSPGGGQGPPHYYPLTIIVESAVIYDGNQKEVVLPYTVLPYQETGMLEVRFWAWVYTPETTQVLISNYVTFKVMSYGYKVYWVSD